MYIICEATYELLVLTIYAADKEGTVTIKLICAVLDVGRKRVKYGRRVSQLKWRRSRLNRITGRGELKHDEIRRALKLRGL